MLPSIVVIVTHLYVQDLRKCKSSSYPCTVLYLSRELYYGNGNLLRKSSRNPHLEGRRMHGQASRKAECSRWDQRHRDQWAQSLFEFIIFWATLFGILVCRYCKCKPVSQMPCEKMPLPISITRIIQYFIPSIIFESELVASIAPKSTRSNLWAWMQESAIASNVQSLTTSTSLLASDTTLSVSSIKYVHVLYSGTQCSIYSRSCLKYYNPVPPNCCVRLSIQLITWSDCNLVGKLENCIQDTYSA